MQEYEGMRAWRAAWTKSTCKKLLAICQDMAVTMHGQVRAKRQLFQGSIDRSWSSDLLAIATSCWQAPVLITCQHRALTTNELLSEQRF